MKISLGKFYHEVTGAHTTNRATAQAALTRWGIPFDADAKPGADAVDIVHLEPAKKLAQGEREIRQSSLPQRQPTRMDAIEAKLQTLCEAVGRVESLVSEMRRRLGP